MTVHPFTPRGYTNTFGPHPPALRIASGDTVITTTIDAHGWDASGVQVAGPPNPQTGPFFVEGAEPGDTLRVRLEEMGPNRDTGWSYSGLAPHVVEPGQARLLPESEKIEWQIHPDRKTAAPPPRFENLGNVEFALQPMLGCIGVAPYGGQAITSATSGPHGGNMDYRGTVAGTVFYFPVFEPGALFFLGDGHALQGDGEISGTGIETSFEVRFTIELLKGKRISWPRGEDSEYIFTLGNARPLDQALQHATSEMLAWLREDYSLESTEAGVLMGMWVRYEVGNVFDPAYTMVCKLPKAALPR